MNRPTTRDIIIGETVDTYGISVTSEERHPLCQCEVPCQKTFRCRSRHHVGDRKTPWCCGGTESESCNECWFKERERRGKGADDD
jgi:hypothetical protein